MILKKFFAIKLFYTVILITLVHGGKSSDESNKPDVARVGKTKKLKMGEYIWLLHQHTFGIATAVFWYKSW